MESLLANYASSDEEEERNQRSEAPEPPSFSARDPPPPALPFSSLAASLFSSLPQPKQTPKPAFSSIPNPQNSRPSKPALPSEEEDDSELPNPRLKLFSSLPQPKQSQNPGQQTKRVVQIQIRPQINLPFPKGADVDDDEDDDDEGEKEKKRKRDSELAAQNSSVQSFLSSLPAARSSATLGALPSSGSGRRSIVDTDSNAPTSSGTLEGNSQSGFGQNGENYSNYANYDSGIDQSGVPRSGGFLENSDVQVGVDQSSGGYYDSYGDPSGGSYAGYDSSYGVHYHAGADQSSSGGENLSYAGGYASYGDYGNGSVESEIKVTGKRGRNEIPAEIVEVKQDELIKNRPREDQMKLTGIAFGPSREPVSTKGKPSKLHKRKHQIGTLFYDMKQKEMELTERRARGFLTKAQTQGKYGW
ncbi:proline-rich protein PRCC-like [Punica granatum]|uniref:Proline-rich protein PRCC-like n=2 Tax=Punica granatum TaxID=22663 RepID=A0A6P8CA63_PUNGR|nr:proline-rich protein PRCC-like [Punica granatum]XP_031380677.1 proline-rich protein PRCC-like [Punica granatum]PKI34413.1 hypothetical protein CRG98_045194 [Punica granatum]